VKINRVLSFFLALTFVLGAFIFVVPQEAAAATKVKSKIDYYTTEFKTDGEKLAAMELYKKQGGYEIYVDRYSGEVAFKDTETGSTLFSNPYDVAGNANSNSIKAQLLSQIWLTYEDNGTKETKYSFSEASEYGQVEVKNIKNGVRVEYAIGEIRPTALVPRYIPKERFEQMILAHITNDHDYERLISFYQLFDSNDKSLTETQAKEIEAKYPITRKMPIYVCLKTITQNEINDLEKIIKAYCSEFYTLDDMEQDHADTDYTGVDIAPACFRMSLEYTIEEDGLSVRLPANGIRFDESLYKLDTVSILPMMGAGLTSSEGYTFIPDGSGAIIYNEDVADKGYNISGQIYGADYAYITITGGQYHHEETMRYPVFGNVMTKSMTNEDGETTSSQKVGFVAIIDEGDSMAQIVAKSESSLHKYSYVYARFIPRPYDKYYLTSAVEGARGAEHSIESKRKYSGSYVIKYKMLSETEKKNGSNYECSYVGMAKAYRDYLVNKGVLSKKTDNSGDIPLYIETFGSIRADSTFLSFPIKVNKALTSFEDIQKIYDELSDEGIKNIRFKLTGYTNGGLDPTYPAKVKWVSVLGGKSGLEDLKSYADEKGFEIYPDFDFAYVASMDYFDGFSEKTDAVKTIDGRYTSRKYYDSATQSLENDYAKAISTSRYSYFGEKFKDSYSDYGLDTVSVSTLGTTLNSDFDQKDPYNREDSKKFTIELLETLKESYPNVMTDGGNAYTLPYVNNIIGVSTDSSNYQMASRAIPFSGFVLHGFMDFSGDALNMAGDVDYSLLKAVENGSSLYFTLAYENINELKEDKTYNKYYSIGYDVWKDEIVEKYTKVNDALRDLQTSLLDSHSYLTGMRIPSESELAADKAENEAKQAENERLAEEQAKKEELDRRLAERKGVAYVAPKRSDANRVVDYTRTLDDGTVYSADVKYAVAAGTIVKETYDDGTAMYLNYNSYDVIAIDGSELIVIGALDFVKK